MAPKLVVTREGEKRGTGEGERGTGEGEPDTGGQHQDNQKAGEKNDGKI